jgi:hypothetical protein
MLFLRPRFIVLEKVVAAGLSQLKEKTADFPLFDLLERAVTFSATPAATCLL